VERRVLTSIGVRREFEFFLVKPLHQPQFQIGQNTIDFASAYGIARKCIFIMNEVAGFGVESLTPVDVRS